MKTFDELRISELLRNNLRESKFITPTPIQAAAIPAALSGNDVLGTAQTGTGKTLAFLIPIANKLMETRGRGIEALVIVPTRELAMQVFDTFVRVNKKTGIFGVLVVGGLSEGRQLEEIRRGSRLVIATPGRLEDYIRRRLINLQGVKILVLDEADRMVDMGFLPQMRNIMNALPKERQTMCFSATMEPEVAKLVHDYLKNPTRVEIGSTRTPAELVALRVYEVRREQKFGLLKHLLKSDPGTFLVFTRTKRGADALARKLNQAGFDAGVIHGARSQSQRTAALRGFKERQPRILVATDVAARGIHVHGIAQVINYDLPQVPEDFIHRVGRTGRVETKGIASTFVTRDDFYDMCAIENLLGKAVERFPVPADIPMEPSRPFSGELRGFPPRGGRADMSHRRTGASRGGGFGGQARGRTRGPSRGRRNFPRGLR